MRAFFTRCPDLAERETRSFEPGPASPLPRDRYFLMEMFCPDAGCDCRRVVFLVARGRDDEVIATLNYGWESPEFYERWSPNDPLARTFAGVYIDPTGTQSRWSPTCKRMLEWILVNDPDYRARIVRHYETFKAAGKGEPRVAQRPPTATSQDVERGRAEAAAPSLAPTAAASPLPAAQQVADVTDIPGGYRVRLPPAFAPHAVARFLDWQGVEARILEGPRPADGIPALTADDWAILVPARGRPPILLDGARRLQARDGGLFLCRVLPRHVIEVSRQALRSLLAALEDVKPEELDGDGRPLPWVSPRGRPREAPPPEDDVEVGGAQAHADTPAGTDSEIHSRWRDLCAMAGIEPPPLSVQHGDVNRCGFVTGRIRLHSHGTPISVGIVTCPNADLAEILATLAHELGHALCRERGHGEPFRRALLDLAERAFGTAFLAGARKLGDGPSRILDQWVASGIRAALQRREPPLPRGADDARLARAIRKIAKLRALAADQVGRPEAIAATGQANDLVVAYGLESYDMAADAIIPDEMLDRYVVLPPRAVWKHRLAHGVARWFDVFSLSLGDRVHLFGRHADLVATEYLYGVCVERIERSCKEHLAAWKRGRPGNAGATRRERTSFCDSAVEAFREKLVHLQKRQARREARPVSSEALVRSEAFARAEHDKRGLGWRSAGRNSFFLNEAGAELGRSLSVVRGVDGARHPNKLLQSGKA